MLVTVSRFSNQCVFKKWWKLSPWKIPCLSRFDLFCFFAALRSGLDGIQIISTSSRAWVGTSMPHLRLSQSNWFLINASYKVSPRIVYTHKLSFHRASKLQWLSLGVLPKIPWSKCLQWWYLHHVLIVTPRHSQSFVNWSLMQRWMYSIVECTKWAKPWCLDASEPAWSSALRGRSCQRGSFWRLQNRLPVSAKALRQSIHG